MKVFLITASVLCLFLAPALAADDSMVGFYSNTVISTGGPAEVHTHYRADHTFDLVASMMGMSRTFKGTWAADSKGNICRTYVGELPPNTPSPVCTPIAPHKVGDIWSVTLTAKAREVDPLGFPGSPQRATRSAGGPRPRQPVAYLPKNAGELARSWERPSACEAQRISSVPNGRCP